MWGLLWQGKMRNVTDWEPHWRWLRILEGERMAGNKRQKQEKN
jgi:hypothetical protein